MKRLSMYGFLAAVHDHGPYAREVLMERGHNENVVIALALRAHERGFTGWEITPDRAWLTDEGVAFLDASPALVLVDSGDRPWAPPS